MKTKFYLFTILLFVFNHTSELNSQSILLDDLNRISQIDYSGFTIQYSYDKLGNRTQQIISNSGCYDLSSNGGEYNQSFEHGLGGWRQFVNEDGNWTLFEGATYDSNNGTGPKLASDGRQYLYTEATGNLNAFHVIASPCFDLSGMTQPTLLLDYFMFGADMGVLEIHISTDNGSSWSNIFSKSGNQGYLWNTASVDLSIYNPLTSINIRIVGRTGSSWRSDIAIDNITITENDCNTVVTNINPSGPGSLKEAIRCANSHIGPDTITFNIPGSGPHVISPTVNLPQILDDYTVIDATTQPGWTLGSIILDGSNFPDYTIGLYFNADHCELYGLKIQNTPASCIHIYNSNDINIGWKNKGNCLVGSGQWGINAFLSNSIKVFGNYIGVSENGATAFPNMYDGIQYKYIDGGQIGGVDISGFENTIGANGSTGIHIAEGTEEVVIVDNFIGTNSNGDNFGNNFDGIFISNGSYSHSIFIANNKIWFNSGFGVNVENISSEFINHRNNSYQCNYDGAIAYASGVNNNMLPPSITVAHINLIEGTSTPNAYIDISSYNGICSSVPCQGNINLGRVQADPNGNWSFSGSIQPGTSIMATQSQLINSSTRHSISEFSSCKLVDDCHTEYLFGSNMNGNLDFEASNFISAENMILSGANVDFDATNYILLDPGFEVKQGAIFHAFIDGCGGLH